MSDVSAAPDAAPTTTDAPAPDAAPAAPKTIAEAAKGSMAAPKTPGPAPWTKDLEDLGLDPETLTKVDQYMRDKVQPRTTQLEQESAAYRKMFGEFTTNDGQPLEPNSAAEMASQLLNELATDPENAVREIIQLMELDPAKFAQVQQQMEEQQDTAPDTEEDSPELSWVQQQMKQQQEAEEDRQWQAHLDGLAQEIEGFNPELYTMAMAAVGPNPDTVMEWYNKFHQAPTPADTPGPTLTSGHATPPEKQEYKSIKDAVKGFAADMRTASQS